MTDVNPTLLVWTKTPSLLLNFHLPESLNCTFERTLHYFSRFSDLPENLHSCVRPTLTYMCLIFRSSERPWTKTHYPWHSMDSPVLHNIPCRLHRGSDALGRPCVHGKSNRTKCIGHMNLGARRVTVGGSWPGGMGLQNWSWLCGGYAAAMRWLCGRDWTNTPSTVLSLDHLSLTSA